MFENTVRPDLGTHGGKADVMSERRAEGNSMLISRSTANGDPGGSCSS